MLQGFLAEVQPTQQLKDLIVLVADKNMRSALSGLLDRCGRLGIRPISFHGPHVHPKRDPGVYRLSHEFLRSFQRTATYALVIFDRDGCGSTQTREDLERQVEIRLAQNGWPDRSVVIVIDPELENWVWSDSPRVAAALGWQHDELRRWLAESGYYQEGALKPTSPKEAVEEALRLRGIPRSSAIYLNIATQVNFDRCVDPAFIKLRATFAAWFPVR